MEGNWNGAAGNNKYQYNEKELNDDFGLDWLDYGARFYDASVGRFWTIDPLAEADAHQTPYAYANNNPVSNIDVEGLAGDKPIDGGMKATVTVTAKNGQTPMQVKTPQVTSIGSGSNPAALVAAAMGSSSSASSSSSTASSSSTEGVSGPGISEGAMDGIQGLIGVAQFFPVANTVAGLTNAAIDIGRGNYWSAGLNLVSSIPVFGIGVKVIATSIKFATIIKKVEIVKYAVVLAKLEGKSVKLNTVYLAVKDGFGHYAGITNNIARRTAEHLSQRGFQIQPLLENLSREDARAVEQALIVIHGLEKNGGTLINKINSISPTNANYKQALERGYELLKSIGY